MFLSYMRVFLIFLCSIGFSTLVSAEVTVPHTFESGAPAIAAEVNENFEALATGIQDNSVRLDGVESPNLAELLVGSWKIVEMTSGNYAGYQETVTFYDDGTFVIQDPDGNPYNSFTWDCGDPQAADDCQNSGTWTVSEDGSFLQALTKGSRQDFEGNIIGDLPTISTLFLFKRGSSLYFNDSFIFTKVE